MSFYKITKTNLTKKIITLVLFFFIFAPLTFSEDSVKKQGTSNLVLLENFGDLNLVQEALKGTGSDAPSVALAAYINFIVKFSMGLLSISAVALIVLGGIKYIGVNTYSGKSDGKDYIQRGIGALLIVFISFLLFDQINPELLKTRFKPIAPSLNSEGKGYIVFTDDVNKNSLGAVANDLDNELSWCTNDEKNKRRSFIKNVIDRLDHRIYKIKEENPKWTAVWVDDFEEDDFDDLKSNYKIMGEGNKRNCSKEYKHWSKLTPKEFKKEVKERYPGRTTTPGQSASLRQEDGYIANLNGGPSILDKDDCVSIITYTQRIHDLSEEVAGYDTACKKKIEKNTNAESWTDSRSFTINGNCITAKNLDNHRTRGNCKPNGAGGFIYEYKK